jgi:hypothetical protein
MQSGIEGQVQQNVYFIQTSLLFSLASNTFLKIESLFSLHESRPNVISPLHVKINYFKYNFLLRFVPAPSETLEGCNSRCKPPATEAPAGTPRPLRFLWGWEEEGVWDSQASPLAPFTPASHPKMVS